MSDYISFNLSISDEMYARLENLPKDIKIGDIITVSSDGIEANYVITKMDSDYFEAKRKE